MRTFHVGTFGWLLSCPVADAARYIRQKTALRFSDDDTRKRHGSAYIKRMLKFRKIFDGIPDQVACTSAMFTRESGFEMLTASSYFPSIRNRASLSSLIRNAVDVVCSEYGREKTYRSELALREFISHFSGLYKCQMVLDVPEKWVTKFSTLLKRLARRLDVRPMKLWTRIHAVLISLDNNYFDVSRTPEQTALYSRIQTFFTTYDDDNSLGENKQSISPCRCCTSIRKTRDVRAYTQRRVEVFSDGMTDVEVRSEIDNDPDFMPDAASCWVNIRNGVDSRWNRRGDETYSLCYKCLGSDGSSPAPFLQLNRPTLLQPGDEPNDRYTAFSVVQPGGDVALLLPATLSSVCNADLWIMSPDAMADFESRLFRSDIAPEDYIRPYGTVMVKDLQTDDDGWRAGIELEVETPERTKLSRNLYLAFDREESKVSQVRDGSLSESKGVEILTGWGSLKTVQLLVDKIATHLQQHKAGSPDSCGLHVNLSHVRKHAVGVNRMSAYSWAKIVQFWNDPANARMILAVAGRYNSRYCLVNRERGTPEFTRRVRLSGWGKLRMYANHTDIVNVENDNRIEVRAFRSDTDPCVVLGRTAFAMLSAMYATAGNRGPDSINQVGFCRWFINRRKDCHLKTAFSEFTSKVLRTDPVSILSIDSSVRYS